MTKYLHEVANYWEYKIFGAVFASVFSESFFKLMCLFIFLEAMDIFTRMISESKKCWCALYPQTEATVWRYIKFIYTARKWRFVKSEGLRSGSDKILIYLLLLLSATAVDSALTIAGVTKSLMTTSAVVMFINLTEMLSVIENISEFSRYGVVRQIKEKIKEKLGGDK